MDLPSELWVKIGSFTDGKTVNSMSRASRRFNGIVENNRLTLPKCPVGLEVEYQEKSKLINFVVKVWRTEVEDLLVDYKVKRLFVVKLMEEDSSRTDEQKQKLVAQFYEDSAESYLSCSEQSFPFGLSSGLDMHLEYLLQRVHFKELTLRGLSIEQHSVVFRQLQLYRSKVYKMCLFHSSALPLEVMPPPNVVSNLLLDRPPQGFCRLPSIRQLYGLTVMSCSDSLLDDDDFCQLGSPEMTICGEWNVSEQAIRAFITQWCEREREIESVSLARGSGARDEEAEREKWLKFAQSLDPGLVRVGGVADRGMYHDMFHSERTTLILVRLSDGRKLILDWEGGISLFKAYPDCNYEDCGMELSDPGSYESVSEMSMSEPDLSDFDLM